MASTCKSVRLSAALFLSVFVARASGATCPHCIDCSTRCRSLQLCPASECSIEAQKETQLEINFCAVFGTSEGTRATQPARPTALACAPIQFKLRCLTTMLAELCSKRYMWTKVGPLRIAVKVNTLAVSNFNMPARAVRSCQIDRRQWQDAKVAIAVKI